MNIKTLKTNFLILFYLIKIKLYLLMDRNNTNQFNLSGQASGHTSAFSQNQRQPDQDQNIQGTQR